MKIFKILFSLFLITAGVDAIYVNADSVDSKKSKNTVIAEEKKTNGVDDYDSLFNSEDIVDEESANITIDFIDEILSEDKVRIGGKFYCELNENLYYDEVFNDTFKIYEPLSSFIPVLNANLFVNVRPETDFRVFIKANLDATVNDTLIEFHTSIREIFVDLNWNESLYFRIGKSAINWGVGYFWSPCNVLNLTSIIATDPEADLVGPLSLKINFPFDANNINLYVDLEGADDVTDFTILPTLEFVLGGTELGFGLYYNQYETIKLLTTVSSSISMFSFFGEGILSFGSDKIFVNGSDDSIEKFKDGSSLFLSGTIGGTFNNELEDNLGTITLTTQYYFNGEGYNNSDLYSSSYGLMLYEIINGTTDEIDALSYFDLSNYGMHYLGIALYWSDIANTDISFSLISIANLSDTSGTVLTSLSYNLIDYLSSFINMSFTYGEDGDEYTYLTEGPVMSLSLGIIVRGDF